MLPLTAINVLLNRDLGLQARPEAVNRYFAVEFSMSALKPIYAALSDLCPLMGRRRVPYMVELSNPQLQNPVDPYHT